MTTPTRLGYLGIGKESEFGNKVSPQFFVDIASASLDTPEAPELVHPGGLTRFERTTKPGSYVPQGNVEFPVDPNTLYYILWLALGAKETTDNTSSEAAEEWATTGAGETTATATLDNTPVVPGTVTIELNAGADVAEDDGFGNLTELLVSGVTGTIDYTTGSITLSGLTAETQYDADYDHGTFEHVITYGTAAEMLYATLKLGKHEFMHTFTSCSFNSVAISIEKEWAMVSAEVVAKADEKENILTLANVTIPQGFAVPFHEASLKMVDYGGSLGDVSADIEKFTLTINNGVDGQAGLAFNSRHPQRHWAGVVEITFEMSMVFDGTDELEDFWGGASAPAVGGTTKKAVQLTLSNPLSLGDQVIDLYKCIFEGVKTPISGRERIIQEITGRVLLDDAETEIIACTCDSIQNWS